MRRGSSTDHERDGLSLERTLASDVTRIGLLRARLDNVATAAAHGAAARIAAALTAGEELDMVAAIHQAMSATSDAVPTERADHPGKYRVRLAR